ncbi:TPA: hypothetical protein ACPSKE_002764 [Legionella feeleii]
MFDFFSFKNNNSRAIKSAAQGAVIGLIAATTQALDLEVCSKEFGGLLVGVIALGLLIEYALPSNPPVYKAHNPGTDGENNGFYLLEDSSAGLKI